MPTIPPLKAVLFDFDGTLVDSEDFHFQSWNKTLQPYHISLEFENYLKNYAGVPTPANAKTLVSTYQLDISPVNLADKREKIEKEMLLHTSFSLLPGALHFLQLLKKRNIPLGLVTGSPRTFVDPLLTRLKLTGYFEFAITRSEVDKSKPHPESYLKALEKLAMNKEDVVVFEDSKSGVEAAKAAGLICIAIQPRKALQQKLTQADKIFKNFAVAEKYLQNKI